LLGSFYVVTDACLLCVCFSLSVLSQEIGWEMTSFVSGGTEDLNSVNQSLTCHTLTLCLSASVLNCMDSVVSVNVT